MGEASGVTSNSVNAAPPTVRTLARMLHLSPTTVSEALRGVPRVNPKTARMIREAAAAAGYHVNPLASAVMSEIRRSQHALFRGTLATVMLEEPQRPPVAIRFFDEQLRGIGERAAQLGYTVESFLIGPHGLSLRRLDSILLSRGIRGVILLPAWNNPDFSQLSWHRYAGVYADYMIERPPLHSVCPNHFRSMTIALQRLYERGYRRPGLVLQTQQDNRLQHVWEGGFLAFQNSMPDVARLPPYVDHNVNRESFLAWFRRHKPDVIVGHICEVIEWMESCGARVPETHGFCSLNIQRPKRPCAGLNQQPNLIGERAAEIVIAQLQRNESGVPVHPSLTTIPALWVDGPTIRPLTPAANAEPELMPADGHEMAPQPS